METITILSCVSSPTQTGKERWNVTTSDGRKLGVWDSGVAQAVTANLNKPVSADIKVNGQYSNLNAIYPIESVTSQVKPQVTLNTTPSGQPHISVQQPKTMFNSETDRSIARATIFNAAVLAVTSQVDFKVDDGDEFGAAMHQAINELTSSYNYVNEQIKTL